MQLSVIPSIRSARTALVLAAATVAGACISWDRSTSTETVDIRLYVSDVQTLDGRSATFSTAAAPAGGSGAALTAVIPPLVLKGGSAEVTFTSPTPFSRLIVAVEGVPGFYDLTVPSPVTTLGVVIVYAQIVGAPAFDLRFAGGTGAALGVFSESNVAFLGNGTGEVQVNIMWNSRADVDLYVVDPLGEEIFYAHRGSHSGGELDIDSNAACSSDGPRAENVFWPFGVVPPRGNYSVRVNYWSECGEPSTDYVVTIRTQDGVPLTFRGRFTGPGVGGAEGAGRTVADFRY